MSKSVDSFSSNRAKLSLPPNKQCCLMYSLDLADACIFRKLKTETCDGYVRISQDCCEITLFYTSM